MASDDRPRTIKLRYPATCATCGVALAAGTKAVWDKSAGGAFCPVASGLGWQVTAVRQALGDLDAHIHPAVCFTSSEWGLFAKPFRHDGVLVTWASKLAETVAEEGHLGPGEIERVAARLAEQLRPAV